jgi:hypothetical protein
MAVHGGVNADVEHHHQHWQARRPHWHCCKYSFTVCSWLYVIFGALAFATYCL